MYLHHKTINFTAPNKNKKVICTCHRTYAFRIEVDKFIKERSIKKSDKFHTYRKYEERGIAYKALHTNKTLQLIANTIT